MINFESVIEQALGPVSRQELQTLRKLTTMRAYPAGQTIIQEGAQENTFYIIATGEVAILKATNTSNPHTLVTRKAGEFFGEMALIEHKPRSASVVASTDTTVIEMTEDVFRRLLSQSPNLALTVMERIAAMLRASSARLAQENVRLQTLYDVAQVLNSTLQPDQMLYLLLDRVMETTPAQRGCLALMSDNHLQFSIGRNLDRQQYESPDFADQRALLSQAALTQTPLWANSQAGVEIFGHPPGAATQNQPYTSIILPLISNGITLGVIYLANAHPDQPISTADPELLLALAHQAATALRNIRQVEQIKAAERDKRELEVASRIQLSLLPGRSPAVPGVHLAARIVQAQHVGGDYYDYFVDAAGRLTILIVDVAGHGVGSALFAATTRSILRLEGLRGGNIAKILRRANATIYEDAYRAYLHLTAFYARFEPQTRRLSYSNAGHTPPLLWQAATGHILKLDTEGLPLGILDDCDYDMAAITLAPGDVVLFYTDGFVEAADSQDRQIGDAYLGALLAGYHTEPGEALINRMFAAVERHCAPLPAQDDLTMVVMHVV
jgi:serine phosphatase RsbU (regulator of sigma subunit)/CRP-like cAMP-binding protein